MRCIRTYYVFCHTGFNQAEAVCNQGMRFLLRDENGFTPYEAAELKRRIADVKKGQVEQHNLVEE